MRGKGGQLEPRHHNDWLSLQKQTPHLLCVRCCPNSLLSLRVYTCTDENAFVDERTCVATYTSVQFVRSASRTFLTSRSGKLAVKRNAIISGGSHLADILQISCYFIYHWPAFQGMPLQGDKEETLLFDRELHTRLIKKTVNENNDA